MSIDFDGMSDDDFAPIKVLPRKPAGRNSPPSKFTPLLKSLAETGEGRATKKPLDSRKPSNGGASQVEAMERELRRAARQNGLKINIRRTPDDQVPHLVTLSFRVEVLPKNGDAKDKSEAPSTAEKAPKAAEPTQAKPATAASTQTSPKAAQAPTSKAS